MANRPQYPEDLPKKKQKKENQDEAAEESILDNIVDISSEMPRLFEVRSGIRRDISTDGNKSSILEKNSADYIKKICVENVIDQRGAIQDIMESALKEFYSRVFEKINSLQVKPAENVFTVSSKPKEELKKCNKEIIHNQRKVVENPGCVKENEVIKLLGVNKWSLRGLPGGN